MMLIILYICGALLLTLIMALIVHSIDLFMDWDHDRREYKKWHNKHNRK